MIHSRTAPAAAELYQVEEDAVRCLACAHRCRIAPGKTGICGVRQNRGQTLFVPDGYVAGLAADPIEKKPFYHVLPGAEALSFGMLGCNLQCSFCQNWRSSQLSEGDPASRSVRACTADSIVGLACQHDIPVMVSTYNEPLITSDWAARIFDLAGEQGLLRGFVSNGYASEEVLSFLLPRLELFKVDLKCFTESGYRSLGGHLAPVLNTIERLMEAGIWVEIVTLVVPGFNDQEQELQDMAAFIARLSFDIPWHVTAFYPTYRMMDRPPTHQALLDRAYNAGKDAGLHFVYQGNNAGWAGDREHTWCPQCHARLIERRGFQVLHNSLRSGCCIQCGNRISGRWDIDISR